VGWFNGRLYRSYRRHYHRVYLFPLIKTIQEKYTVRFPECYPINFSMIAVVE
jgi:hypothetical protein